MNSAERLIFIPEIAQFNQAIYAPFLAGNSCVKGPPQRLLQCLFSTRASF